MPQFLQAAIVSLLNLLNKQPSIDPRGERGEDNIITPAMKIEYSRTLYNGHQ